MATRTYIRGIERYPIDTLNYAASSNYFLDLAHSLPDFGLYIKTDIEYYNGVVYAIIVYKTI